MEGKLPPDLQGTLLRIGPRSPWALGSAALGSGDRDGEAAGTIGDGGEGVAEAGLPIGALHAVEFRDGLAVSYRWRESDADASVFWHAGSVLALHETGLPCQYTRFLEPEEFGGGLSVPIASHAHRVAADGSRVLFSVDVRGAPGIAEAQNTQSDEERPEGIWLRIGEWDANGALRSAQAIELERATWQHDVAVTSRHVVFIESPTTGLGQRQGPGPAVPFAWVPGAEGWLGVVPRGGDGAAVRWFRLDPCLVTHVLGAWEDERSGEIVLYVCRYDALEAGRPYDPEQSIVGPEGVGLTSIGGGLGVLERWRVVDDRLDRSQVDDRAVEYPRQDALVEGEPFRYGYGVELEWADAGAPPDAWRDAGLHRHAVVERSCVPAGLLKFDLAREEVVPWHPGPGRRPSEPLFVRAADGRADDEGWLLSVVDDASRGASDIYVLDASTMGRRGPEAVIHLPVRLPIRSHGEWVPADRYR
jgi:carotenoid cleavage dioxygenase